MEITPSITSEYVGEQIIIVVTEYEGTLSAKSLFTSVATIDKVNSENGQITVTCKAVGATTITVTCTAEDGSTTSATCALAVKKMPTLYDLTEDGSGSESYDKTVFGRQWAVSQNQQTVHDLVNQCYSKLKVIYILAITIQATTGITLVDTIAQMAASIGHLENVILKQTSEINSSIISSEKVIVEKIETDATKETAGSAGMRQS